MKCNNCSSKSLIRKGMRGIKQRYRCKSCGKYQQNIYTYRYYKPEDDKKIKQLNAEGVGIRSMSRILEYSCGTIIRRILHLASKVIKPVYLEYNQVYEVDEMWTFVGKKHPSNYSWITYAMNRKTNKKQVVYPSLRTICIIIIFFISFSCSENQIVENTDNPKYSIEERNKLSNCMVDVIRLGNIDCYKLIKNHNKKSNQQKDNLLFSSFIMANNYSYIEANLDVFNLFLDNYTNGDISRFNEIDSLSKDFTLTFLNKAVSSNVEGAKEIKLRINNLKNTNGNDPLFSENNYQKTKENLVFFEGDTSAYNLLWLESTENSYESFFYLPLFMANKYDYDRAYLDVFETIYWAAESNLDGFQNLDSDSRGIALKYLKLL